MTTESIKELREEINERESIMSELKINEWSVKATTDADGHLTLTIAHDDGSLVADTGCDVDIDGIQWGGRFTTKTIEDGHFK